MAKLQNRVQNALDEGRILILGGQILLGFEYRSFFERGFESLPEWARATKLVSLCHRPRRQENDMPGSDIEAKIRHVLTETRMILPGAQATLGFQLAVTLMDAFEELPRRGQLVHVAAMLLTALAVVLLIAPAAYHRMVQGEETERFHRVAGRFVIAALVPLALSMSCELGIVAYRLTESVGKAVALGAGALVVLLGAWFGFALGARVLLQSRRHRPAHA